MAVTEENKAATYVPAKTVQDKELYNSFYISYNNTRGCLSLHTIQLKCVYTNLTPDAELHRADACLIKEDTVSDDVAVGDFHTSRLVTRLNKEVEVLHIISTLYQRNSEKAFFCHDN